MVMQLKQHFADWMLYRRTIRRLELMDDRLLEDMGISRDTMRDEIKRIQAGPAASPAKAIDADQDAVERPYRSAHRYGMLGYGRSALRRDCAPELR